MNRFGLPTDDVGWCVVTAGFGALWAFQAADRSGGGNGGRRASGSTPDQVPDPDPVLPEDALPGLALFDPDRMNEAIRAMFGPIEPPLYEGLLRAIER